MHSHDFKTEHIHSPSCNHSHSHSHVHVAQNKLKQAIFLGIGVLLVELIGGIWANSLALLSDAWHMFTDVGALIIAWLAIKISQKAATKQMTYGYHRATILSALFNAASLIFIVFFILFEAYHRLLNPQPVQSVILLVAAAIGVVVNLYIGLGMRDHSSDINIRGAMIHVLGDAVASMGVIIGAIAIYYTDWYIIDPILSVVIAAIIALSSWHILEETYIVLMEGVPSDINFDNVKLTIEEQEGVKAISKLHIWSLTSGKSLMSCQITVDEKSTFLEIEAIIEKIKRIIFEKYRIGQITIEVSSKLS
ncbi:MAG: cation diffusion facilitator family transporter [Chlamydiales bacterium]|jgi:cobalt-zinc-cadmium efflux system protein|nr:cation diffusion facilitator family transporter [Chlamydiales bacterium]